MPSEFEIYKDAAGEFRWRFQAANNKIIATSGEGYTTKVSAQSSINVLRTSAGKYDIYTSLRQDGVGEWRWRFVANNGQVVGGSSEGYNRREDAEKSIGLVKLDGSAAPINDRS